MKILLAYKFYPLIIAEIELIIFYLIYKDVYLRIS
jgi:hypothetical protein